MLLVRRKCGVAHLRACQFLVILKWCFWIWRRCRLVVKCTLRLIIKHILRLIIERIFRLVIKCSGSMYIVRPAVYGQNLNMDPGCQPEVVHLTVSHWATVADRIEDICNLARWTCMAGGRVLFHCNRGEVRGVAGFGMVASRITPARRELDPGLGEGASY